MGYKIDPVTGANVMEPDSGGRWDEFLKDKKKIAMAAGIAGAVLLLIIIIVVVVVVTTGEEEHPDDWLMIVGGYHQDDESGYVHHFTLLLALEPEENPVPPCLEKLNNFSMHTAWMHGGTDKDGIPFVCGGIRVDEDTGSTAPVDHCYLYNPNEDEWTEGGEWSPSRASAAHGFGRSLGLVVAGGYSTDSNNEHFKSVKATKDGKTFTDLTDMPVALADHCLVVLEDGLFVAGGEKEEGGGTQNFLTDAYLYSTSTKSWKKTESMRFGRERTVCGHFHGATGTEIIVAGGIVHSDDDGSYYTGKTEVYSLSTGKWRAAYAMDPPPAMAEGVPHGETNLFVGGLWNNVSHAQQYVVQNDSWEHLGSGPIREPFLGYTGALTVKKSIFPKCK